MKKTAFTLFGALLGAALGVPLSYYFQPEVVQRKLTLPKYLSELPKMFEDGNPDYIVPFVLSCVICALALGIVGYFVGRASTSTETTSLEQASHYFSDFRRAQAQKRNHGDALAVRG